MLSEKNRLMKHVTGYQKTPEGYGVVFILGVEQRSGSNFLWQLLRTHPQCHVGSVGEDFLLEHSDLLREYADGLYRSWNPVWRKRMGGSSECLLPELGNTLISYIKKPYYLYPNELEGEEGKVLDPEFESKVLITKTPSVKNLKNFFQFFPDARLLLMVRDGRSVIESGMRSFNWNFEDALHRWRNAANTIIRFINEHENDQKKFMLIRYEDVVQEMDKELSKILTFLDLDRNLYDFHSARNLPVFGSSDTKKEGNSVHWKKVEKTKDFDPLKRWKKWDKRKHDRFNWVAGEAQVKLGYSLCQTKPIRFPLSLKFRVMDWMWKHKVLLRCIRRY